MESEIDYEELQEKYRRLRIAREVRKTYKEIGDIFKRNGEVFDPNDAEQLTKEAPTKPHFPFLIFMASVIKDVIDVPANVSLIGTIPAFILSFICALMLFIWGLGKLSGGWWKKRIISWFWTYYIIDIIIEFIPFLNFVPANSIFTLMCFYKERKIVKLFEVALSKIKKSGLMKGVK